MVVREWKRIRTHLTSKLALCQFSCHFNFLSSTADHDHRILLCISIDLLLLRRTNVVGGRSFDGCGRESFGGSVECYSSSFVYHAINWCEWGGKLLIGTQDNNTSLEKHEFVKLLADRVVGHQPLFE